MELNKKKCVSMAVTNKKINYMGGEYTLSAHALEQVVKYKYLGVIFTKTASLSAQVDSVVTKANRALGFLKRHLSKCPENIKLKAYMTLVRPHMEYACAVWDPNADVHKRCLEMVQRKAVRFICENYERLASVTYMMNDLGVVDLQTRRKHYRLKLFFKHHKGKMNWDDNPHLVLKDPQRRNDNGVAYQQLPARKNCYYYSYFPKTIRDWNELNRDVVSSESLNTFTSKLEIYEV
jgi:hypothetical protein